MKPFSLMFLMVLLSACGPGIEKNGDNNGAANNGANNGTTGTNNGTAGTNNGTIGGPCIEISPSMADFGDVGIGLRGEIELTVSNCGDDVQNVLIGVTGSVFSSLVDEAFVEPGASFVVTTLFSPTELGSSDGALTVVSEAATIVVELTGNGIEVERPCPIARAVVSDQGGNAGPMITVEQGQQFTLDGTGSQAMEGLIQSYRWSSNAVVNINDPNASQTTAVGLAVGTAVIELAVTDENGEESCEPSIVTVEVIPSTDTSLEFSVVWDTPADADQTDDFGADVDLHLLRDTGQWNRAPFDCFWNNPTPMWGDPNSTDDDPAMIIDDTNGAGPETIQLPNAEAINYSIGAEYFSDKGLGPSYATVTVTRGGVLLFEQKDRFLAKTKTFWFVAAFNGANGTVLPIDEVTDGFP